MLQKLRERQKRLQQDLMMMMQYKIQALMKEKQRQEALEPMAIKTKQELKKLVPLIKEANQAAKILSRKFVFSVQPMQNDPNTQEVASTVHLSIRVENLEDGFNYFWTAEKFKNRLALMRDYLEDFFDDGVL